MIAVATGVGLGGLAGARRTASVYERYLRHASASDVEFNVINGSTRDVFETDVPLNISADAAALPAVAGTASYFGLESAAVLNPDGSFDDNLEYEIVGSHDGRFFGIDRAAITRGRLPAVDRFDEVFVTEPLAQRRHVKVGDELLLGAWDLDALSADEPGEPRDTVRATVVGIGLLPDEVLTDEFDRFPRILVPPAFTERFAYTRSYMWQGLRLKPGADVNAV